MSHFPVTVKISCNSSATDIMLDTDEEKSNFFYCDLCPRMYQNYSSLQSHFLKKHTKQIESKNMYAT